MTTPRALITRALKKTGVTGVGQSADPADMSDAFDDLNSMLGQWAHRRWISFHTVDIVVVATGAASYPLTMRPDRIEAAFVRLNAGSVNPNDYPLDVLNSREDWDRVAQKSQPGLPAAVFYDPTIPAGTLYLWPNPATACEVHLTVKGPEIAALLTLDDTISLPYEYEEALLYNLAVRLRPSYQLGPDPILSALAVSSLNTVRVANAQVARLALPGSLAGTSRGGFGSGFGFGYNAGPGDSSGGSPSNAVTIGSGISGGITMGGVTVLAGA